MYGSTQTTAKNSRGQINMFMLETVLTTVGLKKCPVTQIKHFVQYIECVAL